MINNDMWIFFFKEWLQMERIVAIDKSGEAPRYLVKWGALGYEHATWCTREEIEKLPAFNDLVKKRESLLKRM